MNTTRLIWIAVALAAIVLAGHIYGKLVASKGDSKNPPKQDGGSGNCSENQESFGAVIFGALIVLLRVYTIPLALIAGLIWWSGVLESGIRFNEWSRTNGGWQELSDIKSGKYILEATGKNLIMVAEKEGGTRLVEVLPNGFMPELGRPGHYPEPWNLPIPESPPLGLILKVGRNGQLFPYVDGVKVAIPGGKKLWATINAPQDRLPNFCFNKGRVRISAKKI